ncbi:inositol monophosphatase 3-like [Oppia nitens]|uniref:inositol monophosphatase 3-like n=1 Tax=Oppia nitens TaxID=1686743 RepID=UPI0023DB0145|nr:inositol monophosphatase 3-like [Oppia nitens]
MWPYIIRFNIKALLLIIAIFVSVVVFWYYLLLATKDKLVSNSWLTSADIDLKRLLIAGIMAAVGGGQEVVRVFNTNTLHMKSKGKTREGVNDVLTQGDMASHRLMVHSLSAAFPGLRIISEEATSPEDRPIDIKPIYVSDELLYDERYTHLPFGIEVPLGELTVWVDPLDATKEYSEGLTQYVTTMVCVARNGEPIIGIIHKPFKGETYWSWKGIGVSTNIKSVLQNRHLNDISSETLRIIISRSHAGYINTTIHSLMDKEYKNVNVISAAGSGYKTIEVIEGRADAYIHNTLIKKWDICAPNAIIDSINNMKMSTINGNIIKYNFEEEVTNENGLIVTFKQYYDKLVRVFRNFKS